MSRTRVDQNPRDVWTSYPTIGLNVVKFTKSVKVCVKCQTPVEVVEVKERSGACVYKCVMDTCPAFGKMRNRKQWHWLDLVTTMEFRKVGL